MTLAPDEARGGFVTQLKDFAELVSSLSADDLERTTSFHGWSVHALAGHVVGTMSDVLAGRVQALDSFDVAHRQASERSDYTTAKLVEELAEASACLTVMLQAMSVEDWASPAPGDFEGTVTDAISALTFDVVIHASDIRGALSQPPDASSQSLRTAVAHVARELSERRWGPATVVLAGFDPFLIIGESAEHRTVVADALDFVLAAGGLRDEPHLDLVEPVR
ncbi:MAG: hypothetical protein QOI95_2094 [Acidimicrobiaceae bacterium]|jgi:uncharacterized protein (TIGR03083 family)